MEVVAVIWSCRRGGKGGFVGGTYHCELWNGDGGREGGGSGSGGCVGNNEGGGGATVKNSCCC